MRIFEDIEYCPTNGLQLDLFLPESVEPLPVVVWIHGGAWRQGDNKQSPAVPLLTDAGLAVASIRYRFSQIALFPAQIVDCKTAVRWLRAHAATYNLNPDKMGAWGASSGGHLAALLGTAPNQFNTGTNSSHASAVQAVCDWYGPTDFLQMDAHSLPSSPFRHDAADSPESELVGGPIQENRAKTAVANPITYINQPRSPFLIMHGDQDPLVPHHQSELLHAALQAANATVTFQTIGGGGHGGEAFRSAAVRQTVLTFFEKTLR